LPETLPEGSTLRLDGSTAMAAINRALMQRFEATFPNATVMVQEQGTDAALQGLLAGELELAAIGRPLDEEELAQGLIEVPISREKIAIIVGAENPFQGDLTFDQFAQIFRGEITNWSQIGGPDLPIKFVDRPANSDTRRALGGYDIFRAGGLTTGDTAVTLTTDSTAAVVDNLGNNGISYAIASQVLNQDNVRALTMHGTLPDDPRYPYSQPRGYVYQGTPTPAVEAFLAFATTPEGTAAVEAAKAAEAADVATAELPNSTAAMRPNGEGFVTGDRNGLISFWSADGGALGEPLPAHTGPVTALAFSPDGNRIISGGADGTVRFWDAVGNPVGEPIAAHSSPVSTLAVWPDGTFVTGSTDGTLRPWDTLGNPTGEPIAAHGGTVRSVATAADGQTLATAGKDGVAKLWSADGTPQAELQGHSGPVNAIAFTPDGAVVSGGEDGTVRRWDGAGAAVGEPAPLAGPVNAIAVSPDGTVAAGDETGTVQRFDANLAPLGEPVDSGEAPVGDLAFTPTGDRLVVTTGAETPQVRDEAGQLIPPAADGNSESDGAATAPFSLEGLWQQMQQVPLRFWLLIPIAILGLVVWSILRGYLREFGDDEPAAGGAAGSEPEDGADEPAIPATAPPATGGGDDWADFGEAASGDFDAADFGDRADFSSPAAGAAWDAPSPAPGPEELPAAVAAVSPYEAANSLDGNLARAKSALQSGVDMAQSGRLQPALEAMNQAIEAADVERLKAIAAGVSLSGVSLLVAQAMARRGGVLAALGRREDALKSYDRALHMDSDTPDNWIGKGEVLLALERPDEALFCFDKAIEIDDRLGSAWHGKAKALHKLGRTSDAQAALNRAKTLGPGGNSTQFKPMATGLEGAAQQMAKAASRLTPPPGKNQGGPPGAADTTDDPSLPSDLADAVSFLPESPDEPDGSESRPPIPVPPEVQAMLEAETLSAETAPGAVEPSSHSPEASDTPEVMEAPAGADSPEAADAVDAPRSVDPLQKADPSPGPISPLPPAMPPGVADSAIAADLAELDEEPIDDLTLFSSGGAMETPGGPSTVENADFALFDDDIPAEVLAALGSIPADSPDSFNLPESPPPAPRRAAPPPLPNNPRLQDDA
jgi:ABC-type phosphate transport system substrate-binding protein/tetratricopeptide (TPR) repeat protein